MDIDASSSCSLWRAMEGLSQEAKEQQDDLKPKESEMNSEIWSQLPEVLLDKIFARLPLRALFRTRILSKRWDGAIARSLSFQAEISSLSSKWEYYCPVFWSWSCEWLIGYDRRSQTWHKLFKISYFPGISKVRWLSGGGAGSLLCFHQGGWSGGDLFIHVTNPFLRKWHKLPSTNTPSRPMLDIVHALPLGSNDYEVIVITQDDRNVFGEEAAPFNSPRSALCAEVYNRHTDSWTTDNAGPLVPREMRKVSSAFFDGTLYFVLANCGFKSFKNLRLFAYHARRRQWTVIPHPFEEQDDVYQCGIVVCHRKVLLVMMSNRDRPQHTFKFPHSIHGPSYIPRNSIHIYRIDVHTHEILEVCRGPDEDIEDAEIVEGFASDDECLYLQAYGHGIVLQFDFPKRIWSCLPIVSGPIHYHSRPDISARWFGPNFKWTNVTFQPGLNPFAMLELQPGPLDSNLRHYDNSIPGTVSDQTHEHQLVT
ncbi:hypothetical protein R1flu_020166 [Riccia fluitans]|uniref:F-box domain-containing protein n=1 Tax=Riccia fluitans TaxID=41844 RepID=A0ABD1ZL00_9MARC